MSNFNGLLQKLLDANDTMGCFKNCSTRMIPLLDGIKQLIANGTFYSGTISSAPVTRSAICPIFRKWHSKPV